MAETSLRSHRGRPLTVSTPSFMDTWKEKVAASHADEVARGDHDALCEWRPAGHFLCHCSMRRRIAAGHLKPPGELIYQSPTCPRCHHEVQHDGDSYCCGTCSAHWPEPYGVAQFTDEYGDLDPTPYDQPAEGGPDICPPTADTSE